MFKRITAALLAALLCAGALPAAHAADAQAMQQTVRALGILTGDENGDLNLSSPVTRAEFTKMMCGRGRAGRRDQHSGQHLGVQRRQKQSLGGRICQSRGG